MTSILSKKFKNDIYFSLCFAVFFSALNAQSHVQKLLTVSIRQDNPDYHADGFICFGVVYTFWGLTAWVSPAIIVITGNKLAIIIGTLCYMSFTALSLFEDAFWLYFGSAVSGVGAALTWTAQASYLVMNSEVGDVQRSVSIFWMLLQTSYLLGNGFVYFEFKTSNKPIDHPMRMRILLTLLGFMILGVIMFLGLGSPIRKNDPEKKVRSPLNEIRKAFSILTTNIVTVFCVGLFFVFSGVNLTCMSVLATSMAFSSYLSPNSRKYAPVSGILQGIGEIAACGLSFWLKEKTWLNLKLMLTAGCTTTLLGYGIAFFSLPNSSVFTYTDQLPIAELPVGSLFAAHILIGVGDAFINIEMYKSVGNTYPDNSVPAFAAFKFIRSVATAASFYYSSFIGLYVQLSVLIALSILLLITHHFVVPKPMKTRTYNGDEAVPSIPSPVPPRIMNENKVENS